MASTKEEWLSASKNLNDQTFAGLLRDGMVLVGWDARELARILEVIPASVTRWMNGDSKPLIGLQYLTILKIKRQIEASK